VLIFMSETGNKNSESTSKMCMNQSLSHRFFVIKVFVIVLSLLSSLHLLAQKNEDVDPMPIRLKAQILNLDDETPVPYAQVLNFRTHFSITADEKGRFVMDMLNVDSLSISSVGYMKTTVHIPPNYSEMNQLILYALPAKLTIPEIKVIGENKKVNMDGVKMGKQNKVDPELRGDAFSKKPPVVAALVHPASYMQYYLSKSEREKRETRKAIVSEKQWAILSQYYNRELVTGLTGLSDSAADVFMIYINTKGVLSHTSTEYDVRNAIKEQYKAYKEEGH